MLTRAGKYRKCFARMTQMVSGGALTGGSGGGVMGGGGGDSSESHDTDDVPDDTDSPPALRRRVADKSRPQSELINQILIDKFKVNFIHTFPTSSYLVAANVILTVYREFNHARENVFQARANVTSRNTPTKI